MGRVVDNMGMNNDYNYEKTDRLRKLKGWTWSRLGNEAKLVSSKTIYTVRDGEATPATMLAVADALRVNLEELMVPMADEIKKEVCDD